MSLFVWISVPVTHFLILTILITNYIIIHGKNIVFYLINYLTLSISFTISKAI